MKTFLTTAFAVLLICDGLFAQDKKSKPIIEKKLKEHFATSQFTHPLYSKTRTSKLDLLPDEYKEHLRLCRILFLQGGRSTVLNQPNVVPYNTIKAIHFLKISRDANAIDDLIPLLGVKLHYRIPHWDNTKPGKLVGRKVIISGFVIYYENAADDALIAIGLPAVDAILKQVAEGKISGSDEAAYKVLTRILGPRTLKARAEELKLLKNDSVKKLLSLSSE